MPYLSSHFFQQVPGQLPIQELYGLLVADERRNEQIIDDVLMAMEEARSPILLTERKEHLEKLHDRLKGLSGISSLCGADGR